MALVLAAVVVLYAEAATLSQLARLIALAVLVTAAFALLERSGFVAAQARARQERDDLMAALEGERERADSLERVLEIEQLIGNATDLEHVRNTVKGVVPRLARTRDVKLSLVQRGPAEAADAEGAAAPEAPPSPEGTWETFPIRLQDERLGTLGVRQQDRPLTPRERLSVASLTSLIAVALRNVQLFHAVREQTLTDSLTGCATRTHGRQLLARELRRAVRSGVSTSVIMIDADHFKAVNDQYGHQCGDEALQHVAARIKTSLRSTDAAVRYGGEEFLVVLPDTPLSGASKVAESVRRAAESQSFVCGDREVWMTVSCGVATAKAGDVDLAGLIARADAAMYQAKAAGRNRVQVDGLGRHPVPARALVWAGPLADQDRRHPDRADRRVIRPGRRRTDRSAVPMQH